ncbi:C3 and PZP-like alpha-2-macroglobulin domain-containing protein 8 [Glandiceps talaboti]
MSSACEELGFFETDTAYRFRYFDKPLIGFSVNFKVKAKNDAHIGLSAGPQDKPAMYEIVIGGWRNTKSVIRRAKHSELRVEASTPGILSPNEFREFWISYNNGVIRVGKEGDQEAFMEWTDPDPLPVKYLGYSTGWGSDGQFVFCMDDPIAECKPLVFSTDTTYQYRYLASSSPITRVDFKQGHDNVEASTPGILSPNEFRGFWITYNNGVTRVGREGHAPFMVWPDPNRLPVNNIGYSTGWGSNGEFKFCQD